MVFRLFPPFVILAASLFLISSWSNFHSKKDFHLLNLRFSFSRGAYVWFFSQFRNVTAALNLIGKFSFHLCLSSGIM